MGKKDIQELQGTIIFHNRVGACEVLQIIDVETAKAKVRIMDTNDIKTFVLSAQFFTGIEEYNTPIMKTPVAKKKHITRKVDLDKYRNHPLVKQIDKMEQKSRRSTLVDTPTIDTGNDDFDEDSM